jgi:hypothetical protein
MKINWGTGILLFIILFFIVIFSFIYFTTTLNINLVEEDYYPKGINYDEQWEKSRNTSLLEEKISVILTGDSVTVLYPALIKDRKVEGTLLFYRPSDNALDVTYPVDPDSSLRQHIITDHLVTGKYILKIEWSLDEVPYYQEESIFIN